MGNRSEDYKRTRRLFLEWIAGGIDHGKFDEYTKEPEWATRMRKMAVYSRRSHFRAKLVDPDNPDLRFACTPTPQKGPTTPTIFGKGSMDDGFDSPMSSPANSNENCPMTSSNIFLPAKLAELQRDLAPEPNHHPRRTSLSVEMLDLYGFLDFNPFDKVVEDETEIIPAEVTQLTKEWENESNIGWEDSTRGSLVLELIVDPNFTSDELLTTSKVLLAILELKWLHMQKLAMFRLVLTVLWALSFTAFSAMRQYTEFDDNQGLIWICLVLSIMQIVVMLALLGRWWHVWMKREITTSLITLALGMILMPILVWGCVALATRQALWLLNCLSTFAVLIELKEMRNWKRYFTDPWSVVELSRSTASLLMVCILLSGITEPQHTVWVMSILTFFGFLQIAKELRGRPVFGVYISLIYGVMQATLTFMLLMMLCVIALTFGWWVLSMQRPDAHFLQEEASIQCVKTATGLVCGSNPQSHSSMFTRLWASLTFSYRAALLADYPGDAFALADYTGEGGDNPEIATALPAWVFFFCTTYLNLIVLLNLLIAIMNSTFEELWNRAYVVFLRQRALICLEFERTVGLGLETQLVCDKKMVFSYPDEQRNRPRDKWEEADGKAEERHRALVKKLDEMLLKSRERENLAEKLDALIGKVKALEEDNKGTAETLSNKMEALSTKVGDVRRKSKKKASAIKRKVDEPARPSGKELAHTNLSNALNG